MAEDPKQRFRRILSDLSSDDRTFLDSGLRRIYSESLSYGLKNKYLSTDEVTKYQGLARERDAALRKVNVTDQQGRPISKETTVPVMRNGQVVQEKRVTPVTPFDLLRKTGGQMDGGPADGPLFTGYTLDLDSPLGASRKKFQEQIIPAAQKQAQQLEKTQGVSSMTAGKYATIGAGALAGVPMGAAKDVYALSRRALGEDPMDIAREVYGQPQAGLDNPFMFGAERSAIAGQTFAQSLIPSVLGTGAGILAGGATGAVNPLLGLVAGVGTAMATTAGVSKAQDFLLGAAFGDDLYKARQSQIAQQTAENPYGAYAGELATNLVLAGPSLPKLGEFMSGAKSAVAAGKLARAARPLTDMGVSIPSPTVPMTQLGQRLSQGAIGQAVSRTGQAIERSAIGRATNLDVMSAAAKGFVANPEGYRFATDIAERGIEGSVDLATALLDKKRQESEGKESDSYLTIFAKTLAGSMFEGEHRLGTKVMSPFVAGGEALTGAINKQFGTTGMFPFGPQSSKFTPKQVQQATTPDGQPVQPVQGVATKRILPENMVPMGNGRIGVINRENFTVEPMNVADLPDEFKDLRLAFGGFDAAGGKALLDGVSTLKPEENGWFRGLFFGPKGMEGVQNNGQMEMLVGATQEGLAITRDLSADNQISVSVKSMDMLAPENRSRAEAIFSAGNIQPANVTGYTKSGYDGDAIRSLETSGINPKEFSDEVYVGNELTPGRIVGTVDDRHVAMQIPSPNGGFDFIVTPVANLETRSRKVREVFDYTGATKADPSEVQIDRKRYNPFYNGADKISLQGINGPVMLTPDQMAQVESSQTSIDDIVKQSQDAGDARDITITKEKSARENASGALVSNTFAMSEAAFDNGTLIEHVMPDGSTATAVVVGDTPVGPLVVNVDNPGQAYVVQDSAVTRSSSPSVNRSGTEATTEPTAEGDVVTETPVEGEVVAEAETEAETPTPSPSTETVRRRRPRKTREQLDAEKAERERKKAEAEAKRAEEEAARLAEVERLRAEAEAETRRVERERRRNRRRSESSGTATDETSTPTPEPDGTDVDTSTLDEIQSRIAELEAKILASSEVKPADVTELEALSAEEEAAQQQELLNNLHPMDVQFTDDRSAVAITGAIEGLGDISEILQKARNREELEAILVDVIKRTDRLLKSPDKIKRAAKAVASFYDEMIHAIVNRDLYHAQLMMQGQDEFYRVQRTRTSSGTQAYNEIPIPEDAPYARKRVLKQRNKIARLMQQQDIPRYKQIIATIEAETTKFADVEFAGRLMTFDQLSGNDAKKIIDRVRLNLIRQRYQTNVPVFKVMDAAKGMNEEFDDIFYRSGGYGKLYDRNTNVGQQIIFAFTGESDISTIVHELSHAILDNMPVEMAGELALHMGKTLREPSLANPSMIPFEVHEQFAVMMEQSFINGLPINLNTTNGRVSAGQARINAIWNDLSGFMKAAYAKTYGHKNARSNTDWSANLLEWAVPYIDGDIKNNGKLALWRKLPVVVRVNGTAYRATVTEFTGDALVRDSNIGKKTVTVEFIDAVSDTDKESVEMTGNSLKIAPQDIVAFGGIVKGMNTQFGSMLVKWVSGYRGIQDPVTGVSVPVFGLDNSYERVSRQLSNQNVPSFVAQLDGQDLEELSKMFSRLATYQSASLDAGYKGEPFENYKRMANAIANKLVRIAKDARLYGLVGDVDTVGTLQPDNYNNWVQVADFIRILPDRSKAGQQAYIRQVGPNGRTYNVTPTAWIQRSIRFVKERAVAAQNDGVLDVLAQTERQSVASSGGNTGGTILSQSRRGGTEQLGRTEQINRSNQNRTPEAIDVETFANQATADGMDRSLVTSLVEQRLQIDALQSIGQDNIRAMQINDVLIVDGTVDVSVNTSSTVAKTIDFAMRNGIDNVLMLTKATPSEPLGYSNKGYSVEPSVTFTLPFAFPESVYAEIKSITPFSRMSTDGKSVTIHNLEQVGQSYEKSLDNFASTVERIANSLNKRSLPVSAVQNTQRVWNFGSPAGQGYAIPFSEARNVLHFLVPESFQKSLDPTVDPVVTPTIESVLTTLRGQDVRLPKTFDARSLPENLERRIAFAENYQKLPTNTLTGINADADTVKAYKALTKELEKQFRYLNMSVSEYGSEDSAKVYLNLNDEIRTGQWEDHPLLKDSPFTTIGGKRLRYADVLNAIHGAIQKGVSTTTAGQHKSNLAFATHAALTQDPWATWALWTETVGRETYKEMSGADIRKAGLPALEDVKTGVVGIDQRLEKVRREAKYPSGTGNSMSRSDAMSPAQFAVGGTLMFQSKKRATVNEPLVVKAQAEVPTGAPLSISSESFLDPIDSNVAEVIAYTDGTQEIAVNQEVIDVMTGNLAGAVNINEVTAKVGSRDFVKLITEKVAENSQPDDLEQALYAVLQHESADLQTDEEGYPLISPDLVAQIGQERDIFALAAGLSPDFQTASGVTPTDENRRIEEQLNRLQYGRTVFYPDDYFGNWRVPLTAIDQISQMVNTLSNAFYEGNYGDNLSRVSGRLNRAGRMLVRINDTNLTPNQQSILDELIDFDSNTNDASIPVIASDIKFRIQEVLSQIILNNQFENGKYKPFGASPDRLDARDFDELNASSGGEAKKIVDEVVREMTVNPYPEFKDAVKRITGRDDIRANELRGLIQLDTDSVAEITKTLLMSIENHILRFNGNEDGMNYATILAIKKISEFEPKLKIDTPMDKKAKYVKENYGFESYSQFRDYVINAIYQQGTVMGDAVALTDALRKIDALHLGNHHRQLESGDHEGYINDYLTPASQIIDTNTNKPLIRPDRYNPNGTIKVYHGTGFAGGILSDKLVSASVLRLKQGIENPGGGGTPDVASVTYMPVYAESVTKIVNNIREVLLEPETVDKWFGSAAERMKSAILNSQKGADPYLDMDAFVMSQNFMMTNKKLGLDKILQDDESRKLMADFLGRPEVLYAWVTGKSTPTDFSKGNDYLNLEKMAEGIFNDPNPDPDFDYDAYEKYRKLFDKADAIASGGKKTGQRSWVFDVPGLMRARTHELLSIMGYWESPEGEIAVTTGDIIPYDEWVSGMTTKLKSDYERFGALQELHDVTFGEESSDAPDGGWGYASLSVFPKLKQSSLGLPSFLVVKPSLQRWSELSKADLNKIQPAVLEFELDPDSLVELAFSENELRLFSGNALSDVVAVYDSTGKQVTNKEQVKRIKSILADSSKPFMSEDTANLLQAPPVTAGMKKVEPTDFNTYVQAEYADASQVPSSATRVTPFTRFDDSGVTEGVTARINLSAEPGFPSTGRQAINWSSRRKKAKSADTKSPPPAIKKLKGVKMGIEPSTTIGREAEARSVKRTPSAKAEMIDKLLKPYDFINTIARNSVGGDWSAPLIQNWALTNPFENPKMFFQQFLIGTKMMKPNLGFQLRDGRVINSGGMLGRKEFHQLGDELRASGFYQLGKEAGLVTNTSRVDDALAEAQKKDPRKSLMDIDELGHDPDFAIAHSILKRVPLNSGAERTMSMQKDYIKQTKFNAGMRNFMEMGYNPKASGFKEIARDFAAVLNVAAGDTKFVNDDERDELIGRMTKRILFAPRWVTSRVMFDPIARYAVEFLPKGKEWLKVNRMLAEGRKLNEYAVAENRRLWAKGYMMWAAIVMLLTRFNPFNEHAVEVESSKSGTQLRVGDYTFKAPGGVMFMLEMQAMISSAMDTRPDETREERLDRTVDMFKGFLMSKISPAISLGYEQFTGRDIIGKSSREAYTPLQVWWDNAIRPSLKEAGIDHEMPKWSNMVANRMLYLWAQDALETYEATTERNADAPGLEAAFTGASAFLGGRVRYAPKETRWMYKADENATPPGWEYSFIGADPDAFFKALPAGE